MSSGTHVMLNCFLSMGIPMLWALYELWSLRNHRAGGQDRRAAPPAPPKPLPDCLIPKPIARDRIPAQTTRGRVLEDA